MCDRQVGSCLILKASGISTTHIRPKSKFYLFPVGLDSEKSIVSEKMRKERKKRGKEAKIWGKDANLMSYGYIGDEFMIVLNNHAFLCKKVIRQRRALVYCNKMHYAFLKEQHRR